MGNPNVKAVVAVGIVSLVWGCKSEAVLEASPKSKTSDEAYVKSPTGLPSANRSGASPTSSGTGQPSKITRSNRPPSPIGHPLSAAIIANNYKMPPTPSLPKADVTVEVAYKTGNVAVEVEAICKLGEENIACWDTNGNPNDQIAQKVKDSIAKQQSLGGGTPISVFFGRKNRLIITKTTQPSGYDGRSPSINLMSAGSQVTGSGYFNLSLNTPAMVQPNQPIVRYDSRFAIEDITAKTTSVRISQSDPILEKATMDCKVGATATFAGDTYTIQSIHKGIEANRGFMPPQPGGNDNLWTIKVKRTQKSKRPVYAMLVPQGADGVAFQFADYSGNPVTFTQYQKEMQDMYSKRPPNAQMPRRFRPVSNGYSINSGSNGSENVYTFALNPAKIAKFSLQGSNNKSIDIVGIPLDPKRTGLKAFVRAAQP